MEGADDVDELAGDGLVRELEPNIEMGPVEGPPTKTVSTPIFDLTSSGLSSSMFNYRPQRIPQTPSTRLFQARIQASSPIQLSNSKEMLAPRKTKALRKRKTAASMMPSQDNLRRTPPGRTNTNTKVTNLDIGGTRTVFESESEVDFDMT
jgi:hypothetical protein